MEYKFALFADGVSVKRVPVPSDVYDTLLEKSPNSFVGVYTNDVSPQQVADDIEATLS